MNDKELKDILESMRGLIQTHTAAVSELIELKKEVMTNSIKHVEQNGLNKLVAQRLTNIEEQGEKHGEAINAMRMTAAKGFGALGIIIPIAYKALEKLWP